MKQTGKSAAYVPLALMAALCLATPTVALARDTAPPNSPPPLTEAERSVGTPGVPFSNIIVASGPTAVAPADVREGEMIARIPYAYRYTAVVTEDVKGFSITVKGIQAPIGSPGYYVGSLMMTGGYGSWDDKAPMDMWCFLPRVAGGKRENICLLRNNPKRAAIAPTRLNPYLWDHFSPMTGTFDYVNTPMFKRQDVKLPISPELEYRFAGWKGNAALFRMYVMGSLVGPVSVPRGVDGRYQLRTIGGDLEVTNSPADGKAAQVTLTSSTSRLEQ